MDVESTCGEVFLREVILLRITSAGTRNPPEDGNSSGNDQLMNDESTACMVNPPRITVPAQD
jgi:hypothetical protein